MLEDEEIKIIMRNWYDELDTMEQIPLWDEGAPGFDPSIEGQRQPSLAILPAHEGAPRGAVIVCAGGAYLCKSEYEGKPVAQYLHSAGFGAAVLDYRVKPYKPTDILADAKRAVRLMRFRAGEFNIKADRIAILGFSAGGHLAGLTATLYDSGNCEATDPIELKSSRPDAAIQCYGSVSLASVPGLEWLLDTGNDIRKTVEYSPDKNIRHDSPPFFLWQTADDDIVNVKHILSMAKELSDRRIPYELHIFPHGPHGLGLADGNNTDIPSNTQAAQWAKLLIKWLENLGF